MKTKEEVREEVEILLRSKYMRTQWCIDYSGIAELITSKECLELLKSFYEVSKAVKLDYRRLLR